ncbi:hypothetical protein Ddc_00932 [Ditylenchus destructor]|nr:hypothetical protein Ddc_00932 [Ditylenchus destructor]
MARYGVLIHVKLTKKESRVGEKKTHVFGLWRRQATRERIGEDCAQCNKNGKEILPHRLFAFFEFILSISLQSTPNCRRASERDFLLSSPFNIHRAMKAILRSATICRRNGLGNRAGPHHKAGYR